MKPSNFIPLAGKKESVVDSGDAMGSIDDERGASFASFQNVRWTFFIEKATKERIFVNLEGISSLYCSKSVTYVLIGILQLNCEQKLRHSCA